MEIRLNLRLLAQEKKATPRQKKLWNRRTRINQNSINASGLSGCGPQLAALIRFAFVHVDRMMPNIEIQRAALSLRQG